MHPRYLPPVAFCIFSHGPPHILPIYQNPTRALRCHAPLTHLAHEADLGMSVRDADLERGKRSWQSHPHQEDGTVPRSGLCHRHPSTKQGLRPRASPAEDPAVSLSHVHIGINYTLYLELHSEAWGGCYVQQPLEVPVAHTSLCSVGSTTPTLSLPGLSASSLPGAECPQPPPASWAALELVTFPLSPRLSPKQQRQEPFRQN